MGLESLTLALRAAQTSSIATNNIVAGLGKIVDGIGKSFQRAFNSALESARELGSDLLNFYEDTIKPKLEAPIAIFGGNSIMDLLKSAEEFLTDVLLPNAMNILNFFLDLPGRIGGAFETLKTEVGEAIDKISFSNLMNGIDRVIQYFVDAYNNSFIKDIVDDINGAIKKMEGIRDFADKSPGEMASTILDKAPGGGLVQNISMEIHGGITDTAKMIDKAGKGLAKSVSMRF